MKRAPSWWRRSLRRWQPTCTMVRLAWTRSTAVLAWSSTVAIGFSTNASFLSFVASIRIGVCAKSGVAMMTASMPGIDSRSM